MERAFARMDRGIPNEAILKDMRTAAGQTFYLVGTPKGKINQHAKKWLDLPGRRYANRWR